ncbi:MAG: protein kinase domain-containing protein [Gemmatimonadota bacterium]
MPNPVAELQAALGGRYEVVRELGQGGMATVYEVRDLDDQRTVAVKVLRSELVGSVGADRFLREIGIASELRHPGILRLLHSGTSGGTLYYIMPLVDGESLRDRLERERQLPVGEAVRIAIEVSEALSYAHERGVIHRDIKPENILFAGGRALVCDFGIARAIDQAGAQKLTETGLAVGTPAYMSPEQWTSDRIDGRTDQYAVGCMLYELLVGEPPFTGNTPQMVLARHAMEPVPSMRVARPSLAPGLEAIVRRTLSKVPADRFATMTDLTAALRDTPFEATPDEMAGGVTTAMTAAHVAAVRKTRYLGAVVAVLGVLLVWLFVSDRSPAAGHDPDGNPRLVVLPLRNVGAPEDEYFTEGVTEEITSRLSSVANLAVIARASALQYRNTEKPIETIGDELNVAYLVSGSVRWNRSERGLPGVRITVTVTNVEDRTELLSQSYDFDLADVFTTQVQIADAVLKALDITVLAPERLRLAARHTENLTAYDYYLRGNSYYNRSWEKSDVDSAVIMYRKATEVDPRFALAWAQLGKTHTWMHRLSHDETPARLAMARAAIDEAIRLDPELPETHIAQGLYHYWGEWDFNRAIDELTRARTIQKSNAWVWLQLGNIRRRQGEWTQAVLDYEQAGRLDPRFHIIPFNIGHLYSHIRRYDDAERYLNQALALQPTFLDAFLIKAGLQVNRSGDTAAARMVLDSAIRVVPPDRWRLLSGHWLNGPSRIYMGNAARRLALMRPGHLGLDTSLYYLARGEVLRELGRAAEGAAANDTAVRYLEQQRAAAPTVAWVAGALGIAYAHSGRAAEAVAAAKQAYSLQSDALDGPTWIFNEARVHVLTGNSDAAVAALELGLRVPGGYSARWLQLDPAWAPLRNFAAFEQLLSRGSPEPPAP